MRNFKMGRKNYSSDLTDKEWEEIKIYFPDTDSCR